MPPRTKKAAKSKAAKPSRRPAKPARRAEKPAARKPKAGKPAAKRPARSKAKPAKRPAPPKAEESQEQTEPLLLAPIPDDVFVKHVLPLLGVDGLVQLMAGAKTICARLGAVGTPEGKAARKVVDEAYGVAMPADADVLDCSKRLFRWTRYQQVTDELGLDLAKAFACGTVLQGCKDEAFPRPRPRMRSIVLALAESATWLVCRKKFGPRYFDDEEEDIVFKDLRVGEAVDLSAFDSEEVEQGVHSRVRLNGRVTVDFEMDMNYGDDNVASINWSLRVEILPPGGRQSKRSQQAEGLAHWSDFGSDATFGEALWEGRKGYGDGDPPEGVGIREGCAGRLIAALGMSPRTVDGSACYKHLMGVLLYVLAAPFRWEGGSAAVGPALEYRDEANTMLMVIRHQMLLACEWEEGGEDEWDADDERDSSYGRPPRPLCRYREPREGHRTGLWWLGKDPPSEDDFEPPPHSGGGSSFEPFAGVTSLQKRVLDYYTENGAGGDGCTTASVAASLGLDIGQVKAAVEFLSSRHDLHSTIDEDHHRSIYLPKKLRRHVDSD
jgi:hypothetical protein